ncbi:MAG: hypothetical protein ABIP51_14310 [Bacteroidia bacterium]
MKIILEAKNFIPGLGLQDFVMKKARSLNTCGIDILFTKISLHIDENEYLCKVFVQFKEEKIEITYSDKDMNCAILYSITRIRKIINKKRKKVHLLKSNIKTRVPYFQFGVSLFDFSEN